MADGRPRSDSRQHLHASGSQLLPRSGQPTPVSVQRPPMQAYTAADGFAHDRVTSVLADSRGQSVHPCVRNRLLPVSQGGHHRAFCESLRRRAVTQPRDRGTSSPAFEFVTPRLTRGHHSADLSRIAKVVSHFTTSRGEGVTCSLPVASYFSAARPAPRTV